MGLDGGTYITRSDVLRGQSWELNKAENSRSTRGGAVTGTHKKPKLDPKLERYIFVEGLPCCFAVNPENSALHLRDRTCEGKKLLAFKDCSLPIGCRVCLAIGVLGKDGLVHGTVWIKWSQECL